MSPAPKPEPADSLDVMDEQYDYLAEHELHEGWADCPSCKRREALKHILIYSIFGKQT